MLICKFCGKECKNLKSHSHHQRLCPQNPDRLYKSSTIGMKAWNSGLTKESDERVARNAAGISVANKGRPGRVWTEEQKKAKSEWRKKLHQDQPDSHPNRKLAGNRTKMSYPEKVAYDWLTANGIAFEHQKKVGKFYPDFLIGNLIIEIDGERWHGSEEQKARDKARDAALADQGYKVVRIGSKDPIEQVLEQVFNVSP